jgi:hypothetical protein
MAGSKGRELFHPLVEEGAAAGADQGRTDALLRKRCEGRFEIAIVSGIHNSELQAQVTRRGLQVCDDGWDIRNGRIRENAEQCSIWYQLAEQLQLFRRQLGG